MEYSRLVAGSFPASSGRLCSLDPSIISSETYTTPFQTSIPVFHLMARQQATSESEQSTQNCDNTEANNQHLAQPQATPQHPFYSLPSELILDIVDLLPPEAFINFAFANYPLLHSYGLAPALSRPRVVYLTTQTQIPALFPLLRIPPEIMLHVMRNLKPIDVMRFAVANYQDLTRQGIAPPLSDRTIQQLRNAVRARLAPR